MTGESDGDEICATIGSATLVAKTLDQLTKDPLDHAIDHDENGGRVAARVWSGAPGYTCLDWTRADDPMEGVVDRVPCSVIGRVYSFEP